MEFAVFYFVMCVGVGIGARSRGRSGILWFVLSLLISPLISLIVLALLPNLSTTAQAATDAPSPDTHVKCPDCRELVLKDARVCKHCSCKLVPQL